MFRQLYYKQKDFVWFLDHESINYFTLTDSEINRNDNFYSRNVDSTPKNADLKKNKFENKLLVIYQ